MTFNKYKYLLFVVVVIVLFLPRGAVHAAVRPTFTDIRTGFYLDGQNVAETFQSPGIEKSYLLMLPVDYYAQQVANLSVNLRVFNGYRWYIADDDQYYMPLVTEQNGVISMISGQVEINVSLDDRIHEYTLCYELLLQEVELVCNAFRVYTDDGTIYDYGYGVDYYDGSSPYITLYYLDEFFFTDESVLIYCTLYNVAALECDALVPVPGLGVYDGSLSEYPQPPNSIDDYTGVTGSTGSSEQPTESEGWLSRAWATVRSTVDRSWNAAFTWMVQKVVPGFEIDVTPLKIVADYLYFYGVYVSTMRALLPLDMLKIFIDLALWGVSMLWSMMLWNFVKKIAWGG